MPGKQRHSHRKKIHHAKKERPTVEAQPQQAAEIAQPAKTAAVSRSVGAPNPALAMRMQYIYPFILTELRRIGILAGIIIVVLIIVYLALR
jgi:preprotein translocase subunit SecF